MVCTCSEYVWVGMSVFRSVRNRERKPFPFFYKLFAALLYNTIPLLLHVAVDQYRVELVGQTGNVVSISIVDPCHLLHELNSLEAKPHILTPSDRIMCMFPCQCKF